MRAAFLALALAFAGCAASAPPVVVTPPPPVAPAPPPDPDPEPVVLEPAPVPPPMPRGADRDQVVERRVYETARVAEWTLANGLTVVYAWDEGVPGYAARLSAPGGWRSLATGVGGLAGRWGRLQATLGPDDRMATGEAERIDQLLADLRAVFAASPDDGTLSDLRGRRSAPVADTDSLRAGERRVLLRRAVSIDEGDLAEAAVLAEAISARGAGTLRVVGQDLVLLADAATPPADALAPFSDAAVREARQAAAARVRTPHGLADALASLYGLPGRHRPVRPPAYVRDLDGRIERVAPRAVDALRQRLAAAPATRLVLSP